MDLSVESVSPERVVVAGFHEHDSVRFLRDVRSQGRVWPAGTIGAIVYLGGAETGCIVEVEESREGLVDAAYIDLELRANET